MSSDHRSGDPSRPPDPQAPVARAAAAATIAALAAPLIEAVEEHLPGARRHAEATGAFAFAAAVELGHERDRAELIGEAAKLHDAGMVYVPAALLRKPQAELDESERALLASHIEAGARLAHGAGIPKEVCDWILHIRERWAGDGPARLRGGEIPLEARIIRTSCACELLLAGGNSAESAAAALRAAAGTELDPGVVEAVARTLRP